MIRIQKDDFFTSSILPVMDDRKKKKPAPLPFISKPSKPSTLSKHNDEESQDSESKISPRFRSSDVDVAVPSSPARNLNETKPRRQTSPRVLPFRYHPGTNQHSMISSALAVPKPRIIQGIKPSGKASRATLMLTPRRRASSPGNQGLSMPFWGRCNNAGWGGGGGCSFDNNRSMDLGHTLIV